MGVRVSFTLPLDEGFIFRTFFNVSNLGSVLSFFFPFFYFMLSSSSEGKEVTFSTSLL